MIIARIFGWRSSAMNMCSVRHRPIPSAPSSLARSASLGVSALTRTPSRRNSSAHSSTVSKRSSISGWISLAPGSTTAPSLPSIAISSPALNVRPSMRQLAGLEIDRHVRAGHRRHPHPPRHQRGVRGLAALGGEDPLGGVEAGHVVGLGERAHEDHVVARLRLRDRIGGGEHDRADRRARRGRDALREHLVAVAAIERRMQQRVQRTRVDRPQRLLPAEQPLRRPRRPRTAPRPARAASRCASGACTAARPRS